MHASYHIPAKNLPALEERLAKLNKKAAKLGCAPISMKVGPAYTVTKKPEPGRRPVTYTMHEVEVAGEAPVLEGWRFIATLQHTEEGVITRTLPGETVSPMYRAVEIPFCDYCMTTRNRRDTYVVRHLDGREHMVGRSCLRDFLGHRDPHAVADYAEMIGAFEAFCAGAQEYTGAGEPAHDLIGFLAACARRVRAVDGFFVSRRWLADHEDSNKTATGVGAWFDLEDLKLKPWLGDEVRASPEDRDHAAAVALWIEDTLAAKPVDTRSDFEHNLVVASASGYVTSRTRGLVAAALAFYRRAQLDAERAERAKTRPASKHVGAVGAKIVVTARVKRTHTFTGNFGETTIVALEDEEGNVFKWFNTGKSLTLEAGEVVQLKGTVKAHEVYQGTPETVLTRCRLAA